MIKCVVCDKEILGEAFRFDEDLGGFVHLKCKPLSDTKYQEWEPVEKPVIKKSVKHKRTVQTLKKPMNLLKKIGGK